MSLKKRSTTGLPSTNRRDSDVRRKYRSRSQREGEINRLVLMISGVIAAVIVVILGSAFLIDGVIRPAQAVASVGGQNVSLRDFQERVTYERWREGLQLSQLYNNQYFRSQLSDPTNAYGKQYQQMQDPSLFGKQVIDQMVNAAAIKQYADANGIKVDDAALQRTLGQQFGYDPNPLSATPSPSPTLTTTPLVSKTPTSTPTITPTTSITSTATTTPFPTGIPTLTPGATQQKTDFDKTQADIFTSAAKLTGLSTDRIRQLFIQSVTEQELATKVKEAIAGKLQPMQDEVKVRHILVATEDQANAVLRALGSGTSFAELARALSTDTGSGAAGGELGWAPHGKYVAEFEAYVWDANTQVGAVSAPIKTQFGYHIIQLEAREQRQLTDQEQLDVQNKKFTDWLTQFKKDKNNQTYNTVWQGNVPAEPGLDKFGVPNNLTNASGSSGLGGNFPTQ